MECPKCGSENFKIQNPQMYDEHTVIGKLVCQCGHTQDVFAGFEIESEDE
jgi:transcriptional regulator NrdR family protein